MTGSISTADPAMTVDPYDLARYVEAQRDAQPAEPRAVFDKSIQELTILCRRFACGTIIRDVKETRHCLAP